MIQIEFDNKIVLFKRCFCEQKKLTILHAEKNDLEKDFLQDKSTASILGCSCNNLVYQNMKNVKKNVDFIIFIFIEPGKKDKNKNFKHLQNFRVSKFKNCKLFFIIDSNSSVHYENCFTHNSSTQSSL